MAIRALLGVSNGDHPGLWCPTGAVLGVGSVMAKKDLKGGVAAAFPWCVPVLGSCWEGNRTAEENILGECLPPVVLQGSEIHKYL